MPPAATILRHCCLYFCVFWSLSVFADEEYSLHAPWLPKEFSELRLRNEGQSLAGWHIKNEAVAALGFAGTMGATFLISKALPNWIPAQALFAGAGVAIDSFTANDLTDFAARQAIRFTTLGTEHYYTQQLQGSQLWFALSQLLPEVPNLIQGSREWWQQKQSTHNGIHQTFSLGLRGQQSFELHVTTLPVPTLVVSHMSSHPATPHAESPSTALTPVTDIMTDLGLRKLVMRPVYNDGKPLLDIEVWQGNRHRHITFNFPQFDENHAWSSTLLTKNTPSQESQSVYLPLSSCILQDLRESLSEEDKEHIQIASTCSEQAFTATGRLALQVIPLDEHAYLLADHGLSQSIQAPDLWLGSHQHPDANKLKWLESHLVPGAEKGLWRLVSSARALAYRLSSHYLISKMMAKEPSQPEQTDPQPTTVTEDAETQPIPDTNSQTEENVEVEVKDVSDTESAHSFHLFDQASIDVDDVDGSEASAQDFPLTSSELSSLPDFGDDISSIAEDQPHQQLASDLSQHAASKTSSHTTYSWNKRGYPLCEEKDYINIPHAPDHITKEKGEVVAILSSVQPEAMKLSHDIVNTAFDPAGEFFFLDEPERGASIRGHHVGGVKIVEIIPTSDDTPQLQEAQIAWLNRSDRIITIDETLTQPDMGLPHHIIPPMVRSFWTPETTLLQEAEQRGFSRGSTKILPQVLRIPEPLLDTSPREPLDFLGWIVSKQTAVREDNWRQKMRDFIFGN